MPELIKVVDWSKYQGRVGRERIQRMADDGVRGVIVGSWHGLDRNPHCEADLRDARELGLSTSTYIVVNNRPGASSVQEGRAACGAEWQFLDSIFIDVEVAGVTEAILSDALAEADRLLPHLALTKIGIYTGKWFWDFWSLSVGHAILQYAGRPLWAALYNGRFDLAFDHYGGWTECVGHQYAGSTTAYGTTVDFNAFDRDWLLGAEPEPSKPYPVPPREEIEMSSEEYERLDKRLRAVEAKAHTHTTPPTPTVKHDILRASDGHATGFAQRNGISLATLKRLNPQGPPSGNWNLVHAGERFRVA